MPDPVSLNQARKAKARADKRKRADENAVKFGRTKAQKTLEAKAKARREALLSGHQMPQNGESE